MATFTDDAKTKAQKNKQEKKAKVAALLKATSGLDVEQAHNGIINPIKSAIAQDIIDSKVGKKKHRHTIETITSENLARKITSVQFNGNMKGSSQLVVTLEDSNWAILDSHFFDTNENSQIDAIDLNLPSGSDYWWRCTQISPSGTDQTLTLTFMVRECVYLQHKFGPVRANRAKMTRAEFFKSLCDSVKEGNGVELVSGELKDKEPIAKLNEPKSSPNEGAGKKSRTKRSGNGANSKHLTVNGQGITPGQLRVASTAIQVGQRLKAPTQAITACIYAGMGETSLGQYQGNWHNVWGANDPSQYGPDPNWAQMAEAFYKGTKNFSAPGAIALCKKYSTVWEVANATENNAVWIGPPYSSYTPHTHDSYAVNAFNPSHGGVGQAKALAEAAAIVQAGGGGGGTPGTGGNATVTTIEPYFFEINPHESYWAGMVRLAAEVNWELFFDKNVLFYDQDNFILRQKCAAQIHRDDKTVVGWDGDWDTRHIATQMTLTLFCDMFEFMPGDSLHLDGFGCFSTGSTAFPDRLPGRWLIQSFTRNMSDLTTTFTLAQPAKQKLEPAPQIKTTTSSSGSPGSPSGGNWNGDSNYKQYPLRTVARALAAAKYISDLGLPYVYGGFRTTGSKPGDPPKPTGGMDCSGSSNWVLAAGGWSVGSYAPASGSMMSWGEPGPGKELTIRTASYHEFLEFKVGKQHLQFNTVNPGDRGPRLYQWDAYNTRDSGQGNYSNPAFVSRHPKGA